MGRELKRVPLDFDWPRGEIWKGYVCPHEREEFTSQDAFNDALDLWDGTPPPEGEGFQLWETTSEGSPVSPVFETLDALCEWCEDNATVFGSQKTTREKWKNMLGKGFVSYQDPDTGFTFI